jgi:hypothetical protein
MGPTAAAAILCGDPARALTIAQELLGEPRMSNHHRGLWGYHGTAASGLELTVQTTGIGGPAAALVVSELGWRGTRAAIRVGTSRCRGASAATRRQILGATVTADPVFADDGASAAFGADPGEALAPDPALTEALATRTDRRAPLHSLGRLEGPADALPATALHDLQSAALLAAATEAGVALAIGTVVVRSGPRPLPDEPLEAASIRLARAAQESLVAAGGG